MLVVFDLEHHSKPNKRSRVLSVLVIRYNEQTPSEVKSMPWRCTYRPVVRRKHATAPCGKTFPPFAAAQVLEDFLVKLSMDGVIWLQAVLNVSGKSSWLE
ncbi:hypothetical protein CDAR_285111 [Caerostris darwini]|uniref:Uncharacterized protein n=1 Tax=Caerostris darwini TaxID=1538125 RepID=A0AAV4VAR9_9ARAC|nr:hypothetical protein CDAR_285111 [Caerostris darwini]